MTNLVMNIRYDSMIMEPFAYPQTNIWSTQTEYRDPQPTLPEEVEGLPGSNH